jgi:hypothetical protein
MSFSITMHMHVSSTCLHSRLYVLSLACCLGKHFFDTAEEGENVTGGGLVMESTIDVAAAAASSEGDA